MLQLQAPSQLIFHHMPLPVSLSTLVRWGILQQTLYRTEVKRPPVPGPM
jgi:hypothetical protein